MSRTLTHIYRHPVKGFTPEALPQVKLTPGQGLPHDRRYAISNGDIPFDPAQPKHLSKSNFIMLMRNERIAALKTHFDDATGTLTIEHAGAPVVIANLATPEGRAAVERFFTAYMGSELRGPPHVIEAPGHMFSDTAAKVASVIGLQSIRALEKETGITVDPRRFRANFYFEGGEAWDELNWPGREIFIGGVRLKVTKRIDRCAATNVNPDSAIRDLDIPVTLKQRFGHIDMGVYAEVLTSGPVAIGDQIIA